MNLWKHDKEAFKLQKIVRPMKSSMEMTPEGGSRIAKSQGIVGLRSDGTIAFSFCLQMEEAESGLHNERMHS